MNQITRSLKGNYKPQLAVIVYKDVDMDREYYLESHTINDQGQIMEGKPLQQQTMQAIVDVFFDERQNRVDIGGLLPENLLYFSILPGGHYDMTWYHPAEIRTIHFDSKLKLPSGKTWVPALLYRVQRNQMMVHALKNNRRPNGKEKLHRAPFHNIDQHGFVCLGNAKVKKPSKLTYENIISYWEDMFWKSEFSHLNGSGNPTKSLLGPLWKKLVQSKCKLKWSDLDELVEYKASKQQMAQLNLTDDDEEEDQEDESEITDFAE